MLGFDARSSAQSSSDWRWGVPNRVNDDAAGALQRSPRLLASADGMLHALWLDDRLGPASAIYYARRPAASSNWRLNERIDPFEPDAALADPSIAVDGQGGVHLVWAEIGSASVSVLHRRRAPSGKWGPVTVVDEGQPTGMSAAPVIVCDPWGTTHVIWEQAGEGGVDLAYRARVFDGTWIEASRMLENTRGAQRSPSVTITGAGEIVAVWEDTRDGLAQIYASRLPPGSRYWWPERRLSVSGGRGIHRSPSIAAASNGIVTAMWIDETGRGRLREASSEAPFETWSIDREIYRPAFGGMLGVDAVAGRAALVSAVWTETRDEAEGSRVYAAPVREGETVRGSRVDASRLASHAQSAEGAIDRDGRLHVLWQARYRDDEADVLHASVPLGLPPVEPAEIQGRLLFQGRRFGCVSDGFLLQPCDGSEPTFVRSAGVDLVPYLGRFVSLGGFPVEEAPCPRFIASEVAFQPSECPSGDAAVTGLVMRAGRPVEGAVVNIGGQTAFTGPSGRYYFDHVVPTTFTISATMSCALEAALPERQLLTGLNIIDPVELVMGDVVQDCRIGLRDLIRVAGQYKASRGISPPCADLDLDGHISIFDVTQVSSRIGASCPASWAAPLVMPVDERAPEAPNFRHPSIVETEPPKRAASVLSPVGRSRLTIVTSSPEAQGSGWALSLGLGPGKDLPRDMDPDRAGIQPFRLPRGASAHFVVENRYDASRRELHFAATRIGPFDEAVKPAPLTLEIDGGAGVFEPRLLDLEVSDARGLEIGAQLLRSGASPSVEVDVGGDETHVRGRQVRKR